MTGTIPVFKLHGSLNWTLNDQSIVAFQDMRPAFRHGGTAAIIPPVPEKPVPPWLHEIALVRRNRTRPPVAAYTARRGMTVRGRKLRHYRKAPAKAIAAARERPASGNQCERIRKLISRWHRDELEAERKAARRKCSKVLASILALSARTRCTLR